MTLVDHVNLLAFQVNDPAFERYSPQILIWSVNAGQDMFIKKVRSDIIPQLHVVDEEITVDANGAITLTGDSSDLTNTVFAYPRGLLGIRLTDGKFCKTISFREYREQQDLDLTYSTYKPVKYMRGTQAFIQPFTASTTTVDVHYIREAAQLAEEDGETAAVDCEFTDTEIIRVINEFAKYLLYDLNENTRGKAQEVLTNALMMVDELNVGVDASDSIEFGNEVDYDEFADFPLTVSYDFPEAE